jgi:hypothetical protein
VKDNDNNDEESEDLADIDADLLLPGQKYPTPPDVSLNFD